MKIISKFHDYYDVLCSQDREPKPVYLRTEKAQSVYHIPKYKELIDSSKMYNSDYIKIKNKETGKWEESIISMGIIGFCGQIYPYWKLNRREFWDKENDYDVYIYSPEELRTYEFDDSKYSFNFLFNSKRNKNKPIYFDNLKSGLGPASLHEPEKYIEFMRKSKWNDVFTDFQVPIFYWLRGYNRNKKDLLFNLSLNQFEFYKALDPYTAYQELSMFMGNQLAKDTEVDIPVGTDKELAQSKGYDRFSFRQDRGTKMRKGKIKNASNN